MKYAVLVIDVQQGLCEGEHEMFNAQKVIQQINKVTNKARAADVNVIFIQHESKSGILQFGTEPWQPAKGLYTEASDIRIRKTTSDSFHHTKLEEILKLHETTHVVLCGMQTEFCVDTTARRALALGYHVILVEDAHTTQSNSHLTAAQIIQHHNDTLSSITNFGTLVQTIPADHLSFVA